MVQFAGGVTAVQLRPIALEDVAVAVKLVGTNLSATFTAIAAAL